MKTVFLDFCGGYVTVKNQLEHKVWKTIQNSWFLEYINEKHWQCGKHTVTSYIVYYMSINTLMSSPCLPYFKVYGYFSHLYIGMLNFSLCKTKRTTRLNLPTIFTVMPPSKSKCSLTSIDQTVVPFMEYGSAVPCAHDKNLAEEFAITQHLSCGCEAANPQTSNPWKVPLFAKNIWILTVA